MFKIIVITALLTFAGSTNSAQGTTCIHSVGTNCMMSVRGSVLVHAVDESRILIAVDVDEAGSSDYGGLDHLFLFTDARQSSDWPVLAQPVIASLSIDSTQQYLELKVRDGARFQINLAKVQWSHYWGFDPASAVRLTDLTSAQRAPDCDHVQGSCWEANGLQFGFPS